METNNLIVTAPSQAEAQGAENYFGLPSIFDLDTKIDWLIQDMVPKGGITLLTGESGTGKSWLAYAIAGAVARGTPFLGCEVQKRPVLYLDGENPLAVAQRNVLDLGIPETPMLQAWGGWCPTIGPVPGPADTKISRFAQLYKPLLIWDSLVEFHTGDEQSASETRKFMKNFRNLANLGATVIVLHHKGKDGSSPYRGSSDIKAAVDMAYEIYNPWPGAKLSNLTMSCFKSRIAVGKDFGMRFQEGGGFESLAAAPQSADKASAEAVVRGIVAGFPDGINQQDIVELAKDKVSKHGVEAVLKAYPFKKGQGNEKLFLLPSEEAAA